MKKTLVIMLIAAALAAAETLWENPYDSDSYERVVTSWGDYECMDDFTLDEDASIESITCWGASLVWECDFLVVIFQNWWDWPELPLYSATVTGELTMVDYQIKRLDLALPDTLALDAGTYWVEIYSVEEEFDWAVANDGNFRYNGFDIGYDGFFGVYGEWTPSTVTETSWGAVKALSR